MCFSLSFYHSNACTFNLVLCWDQNFIEVLVVVIIVELTCLFSSEFVSICELLLGS